MGFNSIPAGNSLPSDVNAIIEIPANSAPIKYEIDKEMDALVVDRFLPAPMFYPANYGYIPQTLADDGDPVDILVLTPYPVNAGSVIRCRPVGVLNMTDEKGEDVKLLAVPHSSLTKIYDHVENYTDLPNLILQQIKHFFEHYKELEAGKWVKLESWASHEVAKEIITNSAKAFTS